MNCECKTWVRIPKGDGLPMSEHHENCSEYKLESFVRLTVDGATCIVEPQEVVGFISDADDPDNIKQEQVQMTRDQFESLPEFHGF